MIENIRTAINEDFFNQLSNPNAPPHKLELSVGMECYVLRNVSPMDGIVNNTMVRIVSCTRSLIKVIVIEKGTVHFIPRINFTITLGKKNFSILRKQFPLRAAYAKTINRGQGATLDKTGVDIIEEPFAHGQLLVALSRVRSRKDIIFLVTPDQVKNGAVTTRNVVYPELLE